jgi:hypothetical protein
MAQSFACITDPTAEPYAKQQPAGDAFRRRDQPAASRAAPIEPSQNRSERITPVTNLAGPRPVPAESPTRHLSAGEPARSARRATVCLAATPGCSGGDPQPDARGCASTNCAKGPAPWLGEQVASTPLVTGTGVGTACV